MQINNQLGNAPTNTKSTNLLALILSKCLSCSNTLTCHYFVVFILISQITSQSHAQDSILVIEKWGSTNTEIKDILLFQGIEQYHVDLVGEHLKGKEVIITIDEYLEGKKKPTINLFKGLPSILYQATSDTFHFKLLSQGKPDSSLISLFYPRFHSSNYVTTVETGVSFSMRFVLPGHKLAIGAERQAIFAYSLPFALKDKPGSSSYCALTSEGFHPSKWWDEYLVKQCYVFYIQVK